MASTKPRKAKYSKTLDSMTFYIRRFFDSDPKEKDSQKIQKAVYDFCYKYPVQFQKDFLKKIGIKRLRNFKNKKVDIKTLLNNFLKKLQKLDGECVFLLKDTYDISKLYQVATGRGFGILINRNFLHRNSDEDDYFKLIELIYDSLNCSKNFRDFSEKYYKSFEELIKSDSHFFEKSKQITDYVKKHASEKRIIFIDMGFQGTFSLFCWASVRYHGKEFFPDIYLFSVYPWLTKTYDGKYFSDKSEHVLEIELTAIDNFTKEINSKAAATMLGFAVGDSLGFPMAGIDKKDRQKFFHGEIKNFTTNSRHPFFAHLKKGEYTDNTNLLILSAEHLIENKKFDIEKYSEKLLTWFRNIHRNKNRERWLGPTTSKAMHKLIKTGNYRLSGSTTTDSCASTYRAVPLGVFFRSFFKNNQEELKTLTERSSMITHNSDISRTGAVIVALIISDLIHGVSPKQAIESALKSIKSTKQNSKLILNIKRAVEFSNEKNIDFARKYFGTGSPVYQTLPLAFFFLLKFQDNFEKALLVAANSYRDDNELERKRLSSFSWQEQLIEAKGGNTDGIAALTGAFVGAYCGIKAIPKKFLSVENRKKLEKIGYLLVK